MRKLLQFLYKNNHWFLFVFLEVISIILLFQFNSYQHSVYLTSANGLFAKTQEVKSSITSYFYLKSINEELLDKNIELERELSILQDLLKETSLEQNDTSVLSQREVDKYKVYSARIVQNSVINADNFMTINKGSEDGIKPDMGVVDGKGVVGIVYKTSPHYSWIMSLLNSKFSLSCKILGSNYTGTLIWEYGNPKYAYLRDLPRHATFSLGDTLVTSGFSAIFPEGMSVGTIDDVSDDDGLSYYLKIKLAVDFGKLDGVRLIENVDLEERRILETR